MILLAKNSSNPGRFKIGHKSGMTGKQHSKQTCNKLRLANIGKKHSEKTKIKISLSKKGNCSPQDGKNNFNWKGGRSKDADGYIRIYSPNRQFPSKHNNQFLEHILVIEDHLKRKLLSSEQIHHLGLRDDNQLHMLMVFSSQSAHQRFHHNPANVKPEEIIFDGRLLKS